jgi:apolipoprotein N-acyltransferase
MWFALASALLLWASYYPLNLGWLGWIALVPFLGLVAARARPRRIYGAALLCGLAFFVPVLQWMRVADNRMYATWLALAVYCALYFPVALFILRYLYKRTSLPLIVTLPVVWTALEFLRAHLISGFPWYYLAHTQHEQLALIQISDLTGAYGLSALVAAVNALVFEALLRWEKFRQLICPETQPAPARISLRVQGVLVLACIFGVWSYGLVRLQHSEFKAGPRIVLVQPNVPQQIRNEAYVGGEGLARNVMAEYRDLTQRAFKEGEKPALVAWPESSLPTEWIDPTPYVVAKFPNVAELAELSHADAIRLARQWHTEFLVGATALFVDKKGDDKVLERYNSAVLIGESGQIRGRYDKIHRVPFGEYVPFLDIFPWMNKFSPYDFDYSVKPGKSLNRFRVGDYTFGVLICYEDTDPTLARQYILTDRDGPPVDFLVNISNDGWFDGTSEHDQHLATCRFRAVEARRAIARSVNMGVSAVVDGDGRTVALPGATIAGSKKMEGFIACNVPIDDRHSYYAQFGDWFPWSCWILLGAACLYGRFRPVTSSNLSATSSGDAGASL